MGNLIRPPAVAGQFYPAEPAVLKKEISKFIKPEAKSSAIGLVVPHAGYMYSGGVAGAVYSRIEIPEQIIILSPNHTGRGVPFSIMNRGAWRTPLGDAVIDENLADKLVEACPDLECDSEAHSREHSLEVQIPFLQYLKKNFTFVPMTLGHLSYEECLTLGAAIAKVVSSTHGSILIIASTDMNHYEEHEYTLKKDQWAIDKILALDPEGLYKVVHEKSISMCGVIPTTVMLVAANKLGAKKAAVIDHKTSGDITGDKSAVVGYAGVIIV